MDGAGKVGNVAGESSQETAAARAAPLVPTPRADETPGAARRAARFLDLWDLNQAEIARTGPSPRLLSGAARA